MRHLAPFLLVSLAVVACGNASPETTDHTATGAADLINPNPGPGTCSSGYYYQCHATTGGFQLCGCEALSCTWLPATSTSAAYAWTESYEVASSDGSCPDIKAPTGTWKNLSIVNTCPVGWGFAGVPCEVAANLPNQCNVADFPGAAHCCTYVWWPQGYTVPTTCSQAECPTGTPNQSPQALCTHAGMTIKAIDQTNCTPAEMADGGRCDVPGKGTCSTCM